MSITSAGRHRQPWTSTDEAELTAWVLETQANLDPKARGIPRKAWEEIAAKIGKTAKACMARAGDELKLLKPIPIIWTDDQEKKLKAWVKATRAELDQDGKRKGIPIEKWDEIGNQIGKNGPACRDKARLLGLLDKDLKKPWSAKEDKKLEKLVKEVQESSESDTFSQEQWENIAAQLAGRTVDACRSHAKELGLLIPLNRRAWTEEEHDQLKEFVENNKNDEGFVPENQWPKIATTLDRTPEACRAQASLRNLLTTISEWTREEMDTIQGCLQKSINDEPISEKEWEEVAKKVGRSIGACKNKVHRVRNTLREQEAAFAVLDEAPAVPAGLVAHIDPHLKPVVVSRILAPHATQEQE